MAKEKKDAAFEKAAFEWLEKNTDTALLFAQNLVGVLLQNYNGLATHYAKAGAKAKAKAVTAFVEAIQTANGEMMGAWAEAAGKGLTGRPTASQKGDGDPAAN